MPYRGRVKNGVVVLRGPQRPPEGAEVTVHVLAPAEPPTSPGQAATLYERLQPVIGKAQHLAPDASLNHDHYLYSTPKRT